MSTNRLLAMAAIVLAALAPLAGSPRASPAAGSVGVVDVAEWLRDRRAMRVVDLRDSAAFEAFHLPRAVRMDSAGVAGITSVAGQVLVLYDGGDGAARRAWASLRERAGDVYWLGDGVSEWIDEIMNPTLAAGASPEAREAFERIAELSRYFGGLPRMGPADSGTPEERLERTVRRGCAF